MHYVYILRNSQIDKYYIGYTTNIEKRLKEHNSSKHKSKFTRKISGDWIVVYQEEFIDKALALKREREIKSWKSSKKIKLLVEQSRL